ncbi:MAG TPA: 3-hydroxyanthranilate 3,4-dioxygenase [Pyrinomonadaceae bacterium]|nr:3-hydroxyanthranilate 3,4-dioxygenase [Chloracidobacterium sp.]MBP9935212.1 3-hydroxyanthranilate 3,4-dioxygenase [Pyrinomonadaceae bacterium]MBK7803066.1 3-hydroxyanthranilate 3,4-dioxygenase [Chloracidobacterium sp.]MBL0240831.1 3-hydroxyanthranilate 3,4-dioxygenase [Chloracidobacterium sp.]HQY66079.1 3-hydroxyanthranilate 3,4-dioxygenase [Pyrinomonadaceae bacterium]
MGIRLPFNFKQWIDEHRQLLRPPVGNQCVYDDGDFIVMVVGGPNSRKDYHWDEGEELFYQLEGDIKVQIQEDGKAVEVAIREGEMFLLPPRIPHNPIRGENTVGLVIERKRQTGELDGLMWFCENCNEKLYEEYFQLDDITTQFQGVYGKFYSSEDLRTCKDCGTVMEPPANRE